MVYEQYWRKIRRLGNYRFNRYDNWRKRAELIKLSPEARTRLNWLIYYHDVANDNARLTCRHFGLSPKTFYQWKNRFNEANLHSLEDRSKAPLHRRQREYTPLQYVRVIQLRRARLRYGKMKLLALYQNQYPEDTRLTSWKIQCIIKQSGLYYHPVKQARINRKRARSVRCKKITDLQKKPVNGFLVCVDTVVRYVHGHKRYILTAIDRYSKLAFAHMYTTHSSTNARDFLYRLHYLLDGKIENIQTDNGSEFKKNFDLALVKLDIPHYHSRVKTPKDNPQNERFNRTLEEEFIAFGNLTDEVSVFNQRLTEWLVEYNFRRPHQALGYLPPINFHFKYHKVLPMYPSSTPF
ncbi:MAG: integrase core domain-containing protein [Patescibacteria group bacterium]|jgi:transposase InsO family protein